MGDGIHGAVVRRLRVVSAGPVDICDVRELAPAVLDIIDTYQSIFKDYPSVLLRLSGSGAESFVFSACRLVAIKPDGDAARGGSSSGCLLGHGVVPTTV